MPSLHEILVAVLLLTGTFLMTQAVARRALIPQRRGSVIQIAADCRLFGIPASVVRGDTVNLNVTVQNLGNVDETVRL